MAQVNRLDPLVAFWESLLYDDKRKISLIHQTGNRLGIDMNTILKSLGTLKLKIEPKSLKRSRRPISCIDSLPESSFILHISDPL